MAIEIDAAQQGKDQCHSQQAEHLEVDPHLLRHVERHVEVEQAAGDGVVHALALLGELVLLADGAEHAARYTDNAADAALLYREVFSSIEWLQLDRGSITEAAKALFIAQPSLSAAVRELEEEAGITIFLRNSRGILLTQEGAEFLGYARQVVQQAALIEDKYIAHSASRQRFSVSTQHYSFTSSAFVELVRAQGGQSYEFVLREGKTYDTIMDVRHLRSEMGVIYLCSFNEAVIRKTLRESNLVFSELFSARPHIFIGRNNPLAGRKSVNMKDLESLPCLTYEQGDQNSFYFSEEILSTLNHEKSIKVTDKGTIIDLMTGTDGYTISSGICPSYLRGDDIISIPLEVEEIIRIGVITHKDYRPTALGQMYLDILHRVVGDMQGE